MNKQCIFFLIFYTLSVVFIVALVAYLININSHSTIINRSHTFKKEYFRKTNTIKINSLIEFSNLFNFDGRCIETSFKKKCILLHSGNVLYIHDLTTGKLLCKRSIPVNLHSSDKEIKNTIINNYSVSPMGNYIAIVTRNLVLNTQQVNIYKIIDNNLLLKNYNVFEIKNNVERIRWSENEQYCLLGEDKSIQILDLKNKSILLSKNIEEDICDIFFTKKNSVLLVTRNGAALILDIHSNVCKTLIPCNATRFQCILKKSNHISIESYLSTTWESEITKAVLSKDERFLALYDQCSLLSIWDINKCECLFTYRTDVKMESFTQLDNSFILVGCSLMGYIYIYDWQNNVSYKQQYLAVEYPVIDGNVLPSNEPSCGYIQYNNGLLYLFYVSSINHSMINSLHVLSFHSTNQDP